MSDNTYGSYGVRYVRLNDIKGNYIKDDMLFLHIYDYWRSIITRIAFILMECRNFSKTGKKYSKEMERMFARYRDFLLEI